MSLFTLANLHCFREFQHRQRARNDVLEPYSYRQAWFQCPNHRKTSIFIILGVSYFINIRGESDTKVECPVEDDLYLVSGTIPDRSAFKASIHRFLTFLNCSGFAIVHDHLSAPNQINVHGGGSFGFPILAFHIPSCRRSYANFSLFIFPIPTPAHFPMPPTCSILSPITTRGKIPTPHPTDPKISTPTPTPQLSQTLECLTATPPAWAGGAPTPWGLGAEPPVYGSHFMGVGVRQHCVCGQR